MEKSKYINSIVGHAMVLGASGGLGSAVVRAVAASGAAAITITYGRNKVAAESLAAEVAAQGVKTFIAPVEQADEAGFKRLLQQAHDAIGAEIQTVINTIGISPNVPIEEQSLDGRDGWRNVFETNVFGCFLSTRAIAERMKMKGVRGSIVLITSTNGINSQSQFAEHYAPHGIRINAVAPGWIETSLNDTLPADERAHEMSKIWAGRFADPHEIAIFTAFVAGSGGSYCYGQNFMVDGGYR